MRWPGESRNADQVGTDTDMRRGAAAWSQMDPWWSILVVTMMDITGVDLAFGRRGWRRVWRMESGQAKISRLPPYNLLFMKRFLFSRKFLSVKNYK
jgi:hypothetical protein